MEDKEDFGEESTTENSQANPFSADLKGDFTSNYGTSTNAVSHIFKEGGFVGENKSKIILGAVAALMLLLFAFFFIGGSDSELEDQDDLALEENAEFENEEEGEDGEEGFEDEEENENEEEVAEEGEENEENEENEEEANTNEEVAEESPESEENLANESNEASENYAPSEGSQSSYSGGGSYLPPATEPPILSAPTSGMSTVLDQTKAQLEFSWSGSPGGWIQFARNSSMSPVEFKQRVRGNSFSYSELYPGEWYWQVRNGAGKSSVQSFVIEPPRRRNIVLSSPTDGSMLAGSGALVSWTGDNRVAYYRVELTTDGWANPMYRFATSGTQLQIENVSAGQYQLRLGAFSEVSATWEYTTPISVTVE